MCGASAAHQHAAVGAAVKGDTQALEPLLPRRVPYLRAAAGRGSGGTSSPGNASAGRWCRQQLVAGRQRRLAAGWAAAHAALQSAQAH